MKEAPEAVYLIIPLMKELGMRWDDIKKSPRHELEGLLSAYHIYRQLHQFDGYTSDEPRQTEMNKIFDIYKKNKRSVSIVSLAHTTYQLDQRSLYAP